jgi:hypothetical protein
MTNIVIKQPSYIIRVTDESAVTISVTETTQYIIKFTGGTLAGAVNTVFGRTGTVVAAVSDYDASQIDNDSGVSGATVADALNELDGATGPGTDTTAIHVDTASEISAISPKADPSTSDFLLIEDAAQSNSKKRVTANDLPISSDAQTALDAKSDDGHGHTKDEVGLANVDNTSDLNKPVSTATQTALNAKEDSLTFDATPTNASTNPVESNGVFDGLAAKQDTLSFDAVPTSGSFDPVESHGIFNALADKEDTLTFDLVPTNASTNPVESNGVFDELAGKSDDGHAHVMADVTDLDHDDLPGFVANEHIDWTDTTEEIDCGQVDAPNIIASQAIKGQWGQFLSQVYIDILGSSLSDPFISFGSEAPAAQIFFDRVRKEFNTTYPWHVNLIKGLDEGVKIQAQYIDFDSLGTPPDRLEGRVWYDPVGGFLNFYPPGSEVTQQLGEEVLGTIPNNSGVDILNGEVFTLTSGGSVEKAIASSAASAIGVGGMATELIEDGTTGKGTVLGVVNGIDTSSWPVNTVLYLSDTVAGAVTPTKPESPSYVIRIGIVIYSHATVGAIYIRLSDRGNEQGLDKFFNSGALFHATTTTSSALGVVTLDYDTVSGDPQQFVFNEILNEFAVPTSVVLTAGTDSIPVQNYVYVPESTMTLTASTVGFPSSGQFAPIAKILCQSAASIESDGVYKHHRWQDHLSGDDEPGHLYDLNAWIRAQHATWISGCLSAVTDGATSYFSFDAGSAHQLHINAVAAFDMATGDEALIVNDPVSAYRHTSDLVSITTDSTGASLNNKFFKLVFMGVVNSDGTSKCLVNLPDGFYLSEQSALDDADGKAVYTLPTEFKGTGFILASCVFRLAGGVYTEYGIVDRRGQLIGTTAGSGGSGGVSSFSDASFNVFNATDPTKVVDLDVSGVTAGNTRTLVVPDGDGTIARTSDLHAETHTVASHSDTSATGTELNTLTGGASTTLHKHTVSGLHGGASVAENTFPTNPQTYYRFPQLLTIAGNEFYIDEDGVAATSTINWHGADCYFNYIHATRLLAIGPSAVDVNIAGSLDVDGDISASGAVLIEEAIEICIDGGGSAITTGIKVDIVAKCDMTITGWTMLADQSGSIAVDCWKDTYANYPPVDADSFVTPSISSAVKNQATSLSLSVTEGDIIRFNVDSATTVERVTLALTGVRR